ncbi:MAG: MMPL family transporter, partial [Planctomycetales bacterium]|nr:MMPL family transporter [Planctomycetales bacterium]
DPAILSDYTEAALDSFDSTLVYTIVLVITTLLIIYRSPVSPLIPLFAVAVAFGISRALVALLAEAGLPIGTFTETLLVVILFGAG